MARFVYPGITDVRFIPLADAPADLNAPTVAELTGANTIDLVGADANGEGLVADQITGFEKSASTIETPDYKTFQVGKIPGQVVYDDSSMTFYKDTVDERIFDGQVDGTEGYVAICLDGVAAGNHFELFPVTVIARTRLKTNSHTQAQQFRVDYSPAVPTEGDIA